MYYLCSTVLMCKYTFSECKYAVYVLIISVLLIVIELFQYWSIYLQLKYTFTFDVTAILLITNILPIWEYNLEKLLSRAYVLFRYTDKLQFITE